MGDRRVPPHGPARGRAHVERALRDARYLVPPEALVQIDREHPGWRAPRADPRVLPSRHAPGRRASFPARRLMNRLRSPRLVAIGLTLALLVALLAFFARSA